MDNIFSQFNNKNSLKGKSLKIYIKELDKQVCKKGYYENMIILELNEEPFIHLKRYCIYNKKALCHHGYHKIHFYDLKNKDILIENFDYAGKKIIKSMIFLLFLIKKLKIKIDKRLLLNIVNKSL